MGLKAATENFYQESNNFCFALFMCTCIYIFDAYYIFIVESTYFGILNTVD